MSTPAPVNPQRVRFFINHAWGTVRAESRSYSVEQGAVVAGMDERADFPLFGFQLPGESYTLAEWTGSGARIFLPPAATAELSRNGGKAFAPVADAEIQEDGRRRFLEIPVGASVRLREKDQVLVVSVDEQKDRAGWDKQKAVFWLVFMVIATLVGPLMFMLAGPDANFVKRALQEARVKQGLPAVPEPIELRPLPPDDPNAPKQTTFKVRVTTSEE